MENKDWRDEFREYFDKVLKAKKPTIENLDREILVNAVSRILKSNQEEIEKVKLTIYDENEGVKREVVGLDDITKILK